MSHAAAPHLQQRRNIARRVGQELANHAHVVAVLVFGSVASGHVDEFSDVDMLVICAPELLSVTERQQCLGQVGTGWTFGSTHENALFAAIDEDGIIGDIIGDILVTVHYQTVAWIDAVLDEVLEKGTITTQLLPFRPYTLPALLQRAWVLHDGAGCVAAWRGRGRHYPPQLQQNILAHFIPILREQTDEMVRTARRDIGPRAFIFHLDRAVDALLSILYALNAIYDPADRRAERTVLPGLAVMPANLPARLTQVLHGPFDQAGAQQRAEWFAQMADEVLATIEVSVKQTSSEE